MLNAKITKEMYDSMTPEIQAHYAQKGDAYVLDVNGDTPAMEVLRGQHSTALNKQLVAETRAAEAEAKVKQADDAAKAKYEAQLKTANESLSKLRETALTTERDSIVNDIATKFKNPELFAPAIESRVKVEYNDKGEMVKTFMNEKGESITLEQLTDSYCKNPAYSAMLTQPQSSVTLPTNGGQQQQQSSNQQGSFTQPQFGGTPNNGQSSNSPNWGMENGKPVIYNYDKMTPAENQAFLTAMHPNAAAGNA